MKHVFYDYKTPTSFEEHLDFNYNLPYTVRIKKFITEDIVPLHYGETVEILVCKDLVGEFTIDNQNFKLGGKQVFIVPPNFVHSNTIRKCNGTMFVVKISLEDLANFVNLQSILEYHNRHVSQFPFTCPEYDNIEKIVLDLINCDENLFTCLSKIIALFDIFQKYSNDYSQKVAESYALKNSNLYELISWTQQNFDKSISIESVAKKVGYTKCYFCSKFKSITGTTYLDYLNSVRISHACVLLKQNKSITDVSFACGFDNVSYFIQLFKRIHKVTPKVYATHHQIKVANPNN